MNGKKNENVKADPETLFNFFKNANFDENFQNYNININLLNSANDNDKINMPITDSEVNYAIKSLKNNKACGIDQILNEHLKALSVRMVPTLTNLFNLVLDSRFIPDSWTI